LYLTESDTMTQPLPAWASHLLHALEIDAVNIDADALQGIAANVTTAPDRDQLLVGFIAGYAAGLAEGSGMATFDKAHAASVRFMQRSTSGE